MTHTSKRVLRDDLADWPRPGRRPLAWEPWRDRDEALERIGSWSGPALGLALLARAVAEASDPGASELPFVLCVGEQVVAGTPTAARASVLARSPLTGRLAEGQVGSDLAARLARVADALLVRGRTRLPGAVLVGDVDGLELLSMPELRGADPASVHAALAARLGPLASLRVGPAGEAGVAFANLAAGAEPASFVGRGGLGAAFADHGLKALAVVCEPVEARHDGALARALSASPRLAARAEGGTLELAHEHALRGEPALAADSGGAASERGRAFFEEALAARDRVHGCRGCPTPCGWVFERPLGGAQGGRFGALEALGSRLGLARVEDSLALLEFANRAGLDAKELGECLSLLCQASETGGSKGPARGDLAALERATDDLVARRAPAAAFAGGALAGARALGLEHEARVAAGEAAQADDDPAATLARRVAARGADPMRTFPFLLGDGAGRARIEELIAPVSLPPGGEDPRSPAGKGRLVWWHENLIAALDVTGFCAFSAAGLLADGAMDLEGFAARVEPARARELGGTPGRRLLAIGASVVLLHRMLAERFGRGGFERPRGELAPSGAGMLAEYARFSGLDRAGFTTPSARSRLGELTLLDFAATGDPPRARGAAGTLRPAGVRRLGSVRVAGFGPLGRALGGEVELALELPATLVDVLGALARRAPRAERWLLAGDRPVPVAYRDGSRLAEPDLVEDGDHLELVIVVAGGGPTSSGARTSPGAP